MEGLFAELNCSAAGSFVILLPPKSTGGQTELGQALKASEQFVCPVPAIREPAIASSPDDSVRLNSLHELIQYVGHELNIEIDIILWIESRFLPLMNESGRQTQQSCSSNAEQDASLVESTQGQPNVSPESKPRLVELSRHPLVVTFVGFLCTGILGGYLTWWLNYRDHLHDMETSIRNSAIAAVIDISELVNERRTRSKLVVSAIERGAPETEVVGRKSAYDEAYILWNAKIPGDLLRMRAGLHWSKSHYEIDWSRSRYEKYIDGLTNANIFLQGIDADATMLMHSPQTAAIPGLFTIMDACLTRAF